MSSVNASREKGYKRLKVWQAAHKFSMDVYRATTNFPKEEQFGLTSQLRRSALSVPTNVVEGQACRTNKEFLNFSVIANRSLAEAEYLLEVAQELGYLSSEQYENLDHLRLDVGQLLNGLIRSLR